MAVDYTTTALLSAVKRKLQIPTGDTKLSDADLLNIADEELRSYVLPFLLQTGQDYFATQCDIALVAGTQDYQLPPPVNASRISHVSAVLSDGSLRALHRVPTTRIDAWDGQTGTVPIEYAIQGNRIIVLPTPVSVDQATDLRVQFEWMHGRLVATSSCMQIASHTGSTLTFSTAPIWTTTDYVTAVMSGPPFDICFGYAKVTNVAGNDMTVGTPLFNGSVRDIGHGLMYNDYVCDWNESCVVQLPEAWHPVLLYAAASTSAREYGDAALADYLRQEVDVRVERMMKTAGVRVTLDAPIAFNRYSPIRQSIWSRYGR